MTQNTDLQDQQRMESEEATRFPEYLTVLRERLWLIVGVGVLFGCIAAMWSVMQIPMYQARAKMVIELQNPKVIETQVQQDFGSSRGSEQIGTHVKLMMSYPVLREVVEKLGLQARAEQPQPPSRLKVLLQRIPFPWVKDCVEWGRTAIKDIQIRIHALKARVLGEPRGGAVNSEAELDPWAQSQGVFPDTKELGFVNQLKRQVSIDHLKGSKLVEISVESDDPRFSAHAANTLATVYIDRNLQRESQFTEFASEWFATHLDDLRKKVEQSEQALYSFRSQNDIVNVSDQRSIAAQRLGEQNSELIRAESARTEAQTRYQQIRRILSSRSSKSDGQDIDSDSLTGALNSLVLRGLRTQEITLLVELANLSEKYGPLHPKMIQTQTQLKELQRKMAEEVDKAYGAVKNEFQLAFARENAVREKVKKEKAEMIRLDKHAVQYSLLEREANSNRQLYDLFLEQMKRADLSKQIQTNNMYLAEPAIPHVIPVRPKTALNTVLGLVVGLVAGIGLGLFFEYGGKTFKGPRDVARHLSGLPSLGWVPRVPKIGKTIRKSIMEREPLGMAANCFRNIRMSLWLALGNSRPFSLVITSPSEQEGKSTLALNLAIAMSQLEGCKPVLIDADLRRPVVGKSFGIEAEGDQRKGLVEFLEGEAEFDEILHHTTIPNLALIPSGRLPDHPTELLHSKKMQALLKWCEQQGYSIICDAPAALPVVDSIVLGSMVSGTVLVVSAGETLREATRTTIERMNNYGINILGVVIQKVPQDDIPQSHQGSHYNLTRKSMVHA